jgi:sec-independent protein translocase protein TatB
MLGIGWSELLMIAVVIIIFTDPKDLPSLMRNLGSMARKAREFAKEFTDIVNKELSDTNKYIKDINGEIQQTFDVPESKK